MIGLSQIETGFIERAASQGDCPFALPKFIELLANFLDIICNSTVRDVECRCYVPLGEAN